MIWLRTFGIWVAQKWQQYCCKKDWHDYSDAIDKQHRVWGPMHGYVYRCRHCGKEFTV